MGSNYGRGRSTLQRARARRRNPTRAEEILWAALRMRQLGGLKFRRQSPIGPHITDFYCAAQRVAIELTWEPHPSPEVLRGLRSRDAQLAQRGVRVLRFRNDEVIQRLESVLHRIHLECLGAPWNGVLDAQQRLRSRPR